MPGAKVSSPPAILKLPVGGLGDAEKGLICDGVVSGGQDSYLFGDNSADVVGDNSTKGTLKPQTVRYFYPSLMFAVGASRPSKWSYNWASFGANLDYVATRRYDIQHNSV